MWSQLLNKQDITDAMLYDMKLIENASTLIPLAAMGAMNKSIMDYLNSTSSELEVIKEEKFDAHLSCFFGLAFAGYHLYALKTLREGTDERTKGVSKDVLEECYKHAAALAGPKWIAKVILKVPSRLLLTDKPHAEMAKVRYRA